MSDRVRWYRRRRFYGVLIVMMISLGLPVTYAIAGSGGSIGPVTVPVERHNDDCGDSQGKKVIGTTRFTRSGDTLSVVYRVSGADPGHTYEIDVWDAGTPGCDLIKFLGYFKVGPDGGGSKVATADVSGTSGQFVVCDYNYDTELYDCGLTAKLGNNQL
jgi:hypothetical protein